VRLVPLKTFFKLLLLLLVGTYAVPVAIAQQADFQITAPHASTPVHIRSASPDSVQEWIVVFSPISAQKGVRSISFEHDLKTALAHFYGPSKATHTQVTPLPLINGAAFSAPSRVIPSLLSHSYIEYIDHNYEVRINPSTHEVAPFRAQSNQSPPTGAFTGKGVIIAIIDTGVDYNHPDLGGCFGVQCKVIGGYDIVDNDPDPFDENGHGTHVAGIAAGTGLSSGVAQGAKILAYRALNALGSGTMASTIEAIQRAIDDGAHIINMSLGASGAPANNPLNLAVREAINMGVLVVASAGNSGPQWGTVSAPGSERLTLTVGALDADGMVARFSSRGPVHSSYDLKPDVSAPGVAILSAVPGGRHIRLSGTSMAAPHVAGLAALVWEMMPHSDVLAIRSRIIQSSIATAQPFWSSGLGIANTNIYDYLNISAHPTSISMKVAESDVNLGLQYLHEVVTVWNFSDSDRNVILTAQLPTGVGIQLQHSATIPSMGKMDLPIQISVDPTMVPYPTETPPVYLGSIRLFTETDTLEIPIIIARPSELELEFSSPPSLVVIHDQNGGYDFRGNPGRIFSMQFGAGTYDVWAIRDADATKWVLENINIKGSTKLRVMDTDAQNTLRYHLSDPNGVAIGACGYSREFLQHKPSKFGLSYQYERSCPEVPTQIIQHQISSLSPNMLYEVSHVAYGSSTNYEYLRYPFRFEGGINGNRLLQKGDSDFRPLVWRYVMPPGVDRASFVRYFETFAANTFNPPSWLRNIVQEPWIRTEHLIPNPNGEFAPFRAQYDAIFSLEADQFDPDQDAVIMITPSVHLTQSDSLVLRLPEVPNSPTWRVPYRGEKLTLGAGPDSWSAGSMIVTPDEISIPTSNTWFLGWNRELRASRLDLEIVDPSGNSTFSKTVYNGIPKFSSVQPNDWITLHTATGGSTLSISREDTYIGNRRQLTSVSLLLNPSTVATAQNCIDRLAVVDALGNLIQETEHSSGVSLVIESRSCDLVPVLKLYHWSSQQTMILDGTVKEHRNTRTITYDLPDNLDAGYVDVSIYLYSNTDRLFEQQVSPALLVTHGNQIPDLPASPSLLSPSPRQFVFDNQVELKWKPIENAQLYRVQLSLSGDFDDISVDSLVDKTTLRLPVFGYGQIWYWRTMARNEQGWGPWSQRRSFTTVIESTSLEEETVPHEWGLHQNFPNPFNPTTTIPFTIGATEHVRVEIFSVAGHRIKSIDMGVLNPGKHSVSIDLSTMASGLYLYQVRTPSFRQTKKMTLIK
jgi:subtilisin family serine protease